MPAMCSQLAHGLLLALHAVAQVHAVQSAGDVALQLPTRRPEWTERLSPHLVGFSLEMDRWTDWAGKEVGKPNEYFNQLLSNIGERSGQLPFVRVGANSEDRATLDLNVAVMNATFPPPSKEKPNPEADHISIGRDFYALSGNLPAGTPLMWGVNLKSLNKSETLAQARLLADAFQGDRADLTAHVKLVNVEIGNEPDLYDFGGDSDSDNGGWDAANYTRTWVEYAGAVGQVLDFGPRGSEDKPTLSPGALSGSWTPEASLEAGLLDDDDVANKISQFTIHIYSGGFNPDLVAQPGELMNRDSVRGNMTSRVSSARAVHSAGLKFVLGETNSYYNHGQPGLSNTVEAALWMTDWMLLAASMGVERVHFHHGVGFRYNAIQPTDKSDDGLNISHPHILPSYHAFLIVSEAVGTSGDSYVAEIPTPDQNLTVYGVWEGQDDQQLARLVVLNTNVYIGDGGEKPSIAVRLHGPGADSPATVKLLVSGKTTANSNVTWAGQSFETRSGKPEGSVEVQHLEGGVLEIPASSIALVEFGKGEGSD